MVIDEPDQKQEQLSSNQLRQEQKPVLRGTLVPASPRPDLVPATGKIVQPLQVSKNGNKRPTQELSAAAAARDIAKEKEDIGAYPSPTKKKKVKGIPTPSKKKDTVKIYQDNKPVENRPASQASYHKSGRLFFPLLLGSSVADSERRDTGSMKQTGLRPLLLRAESAQSVRPPILKIDPAVDSSTIPTGPLTSTPKKVFGTPSSPAARGAGNRNSVYTPSKKGNGAVGGGTALGGQVRDSKELAKMNKSPESVKTLKIAIEDKENVPSGDYRQGRSPRKGAKSPVKQQQGLRASQIGNGKSLSRMFRCG
jgi:hypothetical protein